MLLADILLTLSLCGGVLWVGVGGGVKSFLCQTQIRLDCGLVQVLQ